MSFLSIKDNILALVAKLEEISNVPHCYEAGEDFVGLDFDENGILYKSSTYFSGCGTDYYDFRITWEELSKPLEYFKDKFHKEYLEREAEKKRELDKKQAAAEERDRKEYERLRSKFENQ